MLSFLRKVIDPNTTLQKQQENIFNSQEYWESYPDFETIKKYANYIDRTLEADKLWTLLGYIQAVQNICDYYNYLEDKGFIKSLPFFEGNPKGLKEGVNVVLPVYAIRDYLISNIQGNLSYIFNVWNDPEKSLPLTDKNISKVAELIDCVRDAFHMHPQFCELLFFNRETEDTIKILREGGFSWDVTMEAFCRKVEE